MMARPTHEKRPHERRPERIPCDIRADCCEIAKKPRFRWAQQDSNLRPTDYESAALTN